MTTAAKQRRRTNCSSCRRRAQQRARLWIRVRCDIVSSDFRGRVHDVVEARAIVNGDCRGVGCDGCVWRSVEAFFYVA